MFINEAAKRAVFAYITDFEASDWQSAIDIVVRLEVAEALVGSHLLVARDPFRAGRSGSAGQSGK